MILVDSNVPMYLVGADHPNKDAARRVLDQALLDGEHLLTDAEVFQEILHRYVAIGRREAIGPAFDLLRDLVDEVLPVELADVEGARRLLTSADLSARDAIHVAVMHRRGIGQVMSFDRAFERVPGITRLG